MCVCGLHDGDVEVVTLLGPSQRVVAVHQIQWELAQMLHRKAVSVFVFREAQMRHEIVRRQQKKKRGGAPLTTSITKNQRSYFVLEFDVTAVDAGLQMLTHLVRRAALDHLQARPTKARNTPQRDAVWSATIIVAQEAYCKQRV